MRLCVSKEGKRDAIGAFPLWLLYLLLPLVCLPTEGVTGVIVWAGLTAVLERHLCGTSPRLVLINRCVGLTCYLLIVRYALSNDDSVIPILTAYLPSLPYNRLVNVLFRYIPNSWLQNNSIWVYTAVMGSIVCHIAILCFVIRHRNK